MPPPRIMNMFMSKTENKLRKPLKMAEAPQQKKLHAEQPKLMLASGGAASGLTMTDIRKQFPQYSDLSDQELADKIHAAFYSDMPPDQFYSKIGVKPVSAAEDVTRSAVAGGVRGVADIPGVVGNVAHAATGAGDWIAHHVINPAQVGLPPPPDWVRGIVGGANALPGTDQIIGALPGPVQDAANYKPQTEAGRLTEAGVEMAPSGAVLGGANRGSKILGSAVRLGVVPGVLGEAAAEATPDPNYKGLSRFAGNITGAGIASGASDVFRGPGAAARAANAGFRSGDAAAAAAADPAAAAQINQIRQAIGRNVGAGQKGSRQEQYQNAFADLDRRLEIADATPSQAGLSNLFTPDQRDIIRQLASGKNTSAVINTASKFSGWKTIASAIGAEGLSAFMLDHFLGTQLMNPLLAAAPATAGIGAAARGAEGVAQGRNIADLAQSVTGASQPRAGALGAPLTTQYATTPAPPQDNYNPAGVGP